MTLTDYVVFVLIINPKWLPPKRHTLFSEIKKNQVIEEKLYIDDH